MTENFNLVQNVVVNKLPDNTLHSQCSHITTFEEASAWLSTDTRNLIIKGAGVEVYRSLNEKTGYKDFPELAGMQAYLHSGAKIKAAIAPGQQIAQNLLIECVKGIIQVESFIYADRGYGSLNNYSEYWSSLNQNSCYTFSHPSEEKTGWTCDPRSYNLFNRTCTINVHRNNKQQILYGTFIDTFHEVNIHLVLDANNVVLQATTHFIRVPGKNCSNSAVHLQNLLGCSLSEMTRKQMKLIIGGPEGCTHMTEIMYNALYLITSSMQ